MLSLLVGFAVVAVASAPEATAFGTVPGREHSKVTRAALRCPQSGTDRSHCFDPRSLDMLAGNGGPWNNPDFWGGVGKPDNPVSGSPAAAHCDNADYLDPSHNAGNAYPQTRDQASAALLACVAHAREAFGRAVDGAQHMLDSNNQLKTGEEFGRAKRKVIDDWGWALHTVQDFYSHSNWADIAEPSEAPGTANPPGLNLPKPALFFNFLGPGPTTSQIPRDLTTGCWYLSAPERCRGRVRHGATFNGEDRGLNKDTGDIDPNTGQTTAPTSHRGKIGQNFNQAVQLAVTDTRLQWVDLMQGLENRYAASGQGRLLACALTRDNPHTDCRPGTAGTEKSRATGTGAAAAAPACGAHWQQPGGAYTPVFMQFANCSNTTQVVAPFAVGEPAAETKYTFARICRIVPPGSVTSWVIDRSYFPPVPTNMQSVTHCWDPTPERGRSENGADAREASDQPGPVSAHDGFERGGARIGPSPGSRSNADGSPRALADQCGTRWEQPGGTGTTVTMHYGNCTERPTIIAPLAAGSGPESLYSFTGLSRYVPTGAETGPIRIDPPFFPPEPTNIQWTTHLM
ncbi:hypothetical protein ACH4SP_42175 [Streptomyces sp. NPDC021093]|uniref:hypothetical protein n=1 Tax=Streptomyces sp. NPDC021093 TaxID=3365112 RepID=UPI0037A9FEFB